MNPATENQMTAAKPKRAFVRKKVPSKLDRFTEQLLQMDDEQITIQKMAEWLGAQGVETTVANISAFLSSRRKQRAATMQLDSGMNLYETVQQWLAENPDPELEAVIARLKMLALDLAMQKEPPPEALKLADRLAWTASRVANDRSREDYRKRKLVMEEAKHAEWVKCERMRAFELCLDEAKKYPEVADMYRAAFHALKEGQKQEDGV